MDLISVLVGSILGVSAFILILIWIDTANKILEEDLR